MNDDGTKAVTALINKAVEVEDSADAMRFSQAACNLANALCARSHAASISKLADVQVKHMVDRFLGWKLPENFNPDGGVSFTKTFNEHTAHPMKYDPSGTNLFDATQADAMVRYMLDGLPTAA